MSRKITLEQVAKNNTAKSLWMVIHNNVYNVSTFLKEHPGGPEVLLEFAGKDGTDEFENVGHSSEAKELMETFKIGVLSDVADPEPCFETILKEHKTEIIIGSLCFAIGCAFLVKKYCF